MTSGFKRRGLLRVYALVVTVVLVFAAGVAVGQDTAAWRLRRYLTPSSATELDRQFLAIQIQEIQSALDVLENETAPNKVGVPIFNLNPKTGKLQVLVAVHGRWADSAPISEVEESLKAQAKDILFSLQVSLARAAGEGRGSNFFKDSRRNE